MKVVSLSAQGTGRLYPPENIPGTHFCYRLSRLQDHSAAGRIMSMKVSNNTIGNRTLDLPACSAVPQPAAPPRAPEYIILQSNTTLSILLFPSYIFIFMDVSFTGIYNIRVRRPRCVQ